jgi:hypothetical protein
MSQASRIKTEMRASMRMHKRFHALMERVKAIRNVDWEMLTLTESAVLAEIQHQLSILAHERLGTR